MSSNMFNGISVQKKKANKNRKGKKGKTYPSEKVRNFGNQGRQEVVFIKKTPQANTPNVNIRIFICRIFSKSPSREFPV